MIAPDLPGFGDSELGRSRGTWEEHVAFLEDFATALDLTRADVVVHDWGGLIVWQMPLLHPDRVAGVIGVNTPFIPRTPVPPIQLMRQMRGEDNYIVFFQKPGVADAAFLIKERLEALGLSAFLRLTGGKGLHVVVPVVPGPRWPSVKRFARTFVNEIVREDSGRFTPLMAKNRRGGKIFLDYLRNDRESTAIASYSPRARAGAPVALPIEWDELDRDADAAPRYGLLEVPAVVRRLAPTTALRAVPIPRSATRHRGGEVRPTPSAGTARPAPRAG